MRKSKHVILFTFLISFFSYATKNVALDQFEGAWLLKNNESDNILEYIIKRSMKDLFWIYPRIMWLLIHIQSNVIKELLDSYHKSSGVWIKKVIIKKHGTYKSARSNF